MEYYMTLALALAQEAAHDNDIPVGCVIVKDGEIIGRGRNRRELLGDATAHAEVEAIREACAYLHSWRLSGCTMYVTLEPCPMCAGAIINARIDKVVYGAENPKAGCCGSVISLFQERFNHHPAVFGGVLASECAEILSDFFKFREKNLRKKAKI
jgi:tRNA(adenine34) deaminase